VLLIDADLRRPALSSNLRLPPVANIEAVLGGGIDFESAIVEDPGSGMHCLLNDRPIGNPMKILAPKELKTLLAATARAYDLVVMDSPPVMRVSDAVLLSQSSLFTLFAVAHGRVSGDVLAEAISRFPQDRQARILTVLTRVPRGRMDARDYYSGYGNAPEVAAKKTGRRSGRRSLAAPMGKAADRGMVGSD
jgi:Mrp family chromosome partitioning ATPase